MTFVLDNSVAMRWCFEPEHSYAEAILERMKIGDNAIVPVLWFYEASAVLAREQNRGRLTTSEADEFIAELKSLNIIADEESEARIFPNVHRLAITYRLTSYDASYLELALRHGLPLATLDDDLAKASRAAGATVIASPVGSP